MEVRPSRRFLHSLQTRYLQAQKKAKGVILDEFTQTTAYHRTYARRLLRGRYQYAAAPIRHRRARYYTEEDAAALEHLSELLDGMCSKLLKAEIPLVLPQLREDGTLDISDQCAEHLFEISPATMDRLLRRRRPKAKGWRGFTRPSRSWLKARIPVRTFAERTAAEPGWLDLDLVDHSGGNERGEFAHTLDMVDEYSQWIEPRAIRTKAEKLVLEQLARLRVDLPFRLLGIHSDTGGEFINRQLYDYCKREPPLTFTRSRAGKKNDNAQVEQKNYSVVRRLVGYGRYDTELQVRQLNALYAVARLYVNFFKPVMKLQSKQRLGSKVKRLYDQPKTPYQRLLDCPSLDEQAKQMLCQTYQQLHLGALKAELDRHMAALKPSPPFR
jgi:hypothetical protein